MAKIGTKEAALAALRVRKAGKPAKASPSARSKPSSGGKGPKKAKVTPRAKKPSSQTPGAKVVPPSPRQGYSSDHPPAATPGPVTLPKLGRPSTGFDRKAYQRVYCRLRLRHGPLSNWPQDALQELDQVRTPKP